MGSRDSKHRQIMSRHNWHHFFHFLLVAGVITLIVVTGITYHNTKDLDDRQKAMQEQLNEIQANQTADHEELVDLLEQILGNVTVPLVLVRSARSVGGGDEVPPAEKPAKSARGVSMGQGIGPAFGDFITQYTNDVAIQPCDTNEDPTIGCTVYEINSS